MRPSAPRRRPAPTGEVTAVYVVDDQGVAHLRQVRLGPPAGAEVPVLAGLQAGERVALDPAAAARATARAGE